jgi:curved DNA-binding protein CbpA
MTDYFALLDQPRLPWLDPATLKEVFRRKTLEHHPDITTSGSEGEFARLNEAYQVLQDPKRRLQHLLELQGRTTSSVGRPVPPDLQDLFLEIGATNQRAAALLEKARGASSALARSLLKPESAAVQREIENLRTKLRDMIEDANRELQDTNLTQLDAIAALQQRFAYLGRWSSQLDELAFQLSL